MNARYLRERGWPCPTGQEMRRIDRDAIERRGLPGRLLMELAGRAVAQAVRARMPAARRPLVVCGVGNNGGDGFVVARVLREWDDRIAPVVFALGDRSRLSEEARACFELLLGSGVEVVLSAEQKQVVPLLASADLVIDAIFGMGLSRAVEGEAAAVLAAINACGQPVLSVDLPSGVASDTGEPLGVAVEPSLIVTLGLPKLGLAVRPLGAELRVADIGLPAASLEALGVRQHVWTESAAAARVPARAASGHKGRFGHVLVVGGSEGKTGAAVLAAEGALYSGAGLVTVAVPRSLNLVFEAKLTEAMSLPLEDAGTARLGASALSELLSAAEARDVVVLGPGLGGEAETGALARELLSALGRPAVVDADGLNAFAGQPEALCSGAPRILTPHPGEMARLLECDAAEVQADRVGTARALAERSEAVVVLKGARTVLATPGGDVLVNPTGGPGLASGGTGDVLAGVIGAFLAQGLEPLDAAALGAWVHGSAGECLGPVAVAGAVASAIPRVLEQLRESEGEPDGPHLLRRFP